MALQVTGRTVAAGVERVEIPGIGELSLALPEPLAALRDEALASQSQPCPGIPEFALADARAWEASRGDDWLIWRARRCAERLRSLPLKLEPGELLAGKPRFHAPGEDELPALEEAHRVLAEVPPYPGGDAGHFHPDWEKLLRLGVAGILREIDELAARPGLDEEQRTFYAACRIVMEAFSEFIGRIGQACDEMAECEPQDAGRWRELAGICRRVATEPPTSFHEALQLMFAGQIALWFAEDHGLTSPGRIDQTLYRFYAADIEAGRLTPSEALHLLCCLYIHQNRILWPGSAVAVMVGGKDTQGQNVTNAVTYLALAARQATQLVYPTVGLVWHRDLPDDLMEYTMRMLATGIGDPALFNDETISAGLRDHGVRQEDCHNYVNSTCVEIKVAGASNIWVTHPYINLAQGLLDALNQIADGSVPEPQSFEDLQEQVRAAIALRVEQAAQQMDRMWKQRSITGCFPFASCVISDCLERGRDYDRGGARYNWVENSFIALANLVDGLVAIRELVYDKQELSLGELNAILRANFAGHEGLRQRIINTLPVYGNDDDRADALAVEWSEFIIAKTEEQTVGLHRYVPGMFCWVMHERMGSETGATPDGRLCGLPLADGAGASQGRERCGPTASVLSTTRWDHRPMLGGVVQNLKFTKDMLADPEGRKAARGVIETYLQRGGFEIQVNVVSRDTLLDAQAHPEKYQDLLVRVAGYSDYFVKLNRDMQNEVIARSEHGLQ